MTNFYNMYEFMNMISFYAEQEWLCQLKGETCVVPGIGGLVHTLKYTFPCNMSNRQEAERARLYGTGGILKKMFLNILNYYYYINNFIKIVIP